MRINNTSSQPAMFCWMTARGKYLSFLSGVRKH
jgi:hypothetical protein